MTSIAIIGPDGAGKTTITRRLVESSPFPFKYVYMGINIEACNFALPTTRWAKRIRQWAGKIEEPSPSTTPPPARRHRSLRSLPTKLWAAARLLNRLADEWYRQFISWYYQSRGFIVLYDRHFAFDFSEDHSAQGGEPLSSRLHRWCLTRFYPLPDCVIFLDAPPEVLYARKPEWPIEDLERKRRTLLRLGERLPNFFRIDATQPIETVYAQVTATIEAFCASHRSFSKTVPLPRDSAAGMTLDRPSEQLSTRQSLNGFER